MARKPRPNRKPKKISKAHLKKEEVEEAPYKYARGQRFELLKWFKRPPSVVYKEARDTLAYRLSEAMFASLLAAYVIGFLSVIGTGECPRTPVATEGRTTGLGEAAEMSGRQDGAPLAETQRNSEWKCCLSWLSSVILRLFPTVNIVLVSFSFAFLTSALYLKYQMSILTMPSYDLTRVSRDFFIAVAQGMGFGFAIRWPLSLWLIVGVILLVSLWWVQYREVGELVRWLARVSFKDKPESPTTSSAARTSRPPNEKTVYELVRKHALRDWYRPPRRYYYGAGLAILVGAVLVGLRWGFGAGPAWTIVAVAFNGSLMGIVLWVGYPLIGKAGEFFRRLRTEDDRLVPENDTKVYEKLKEEDTRYETFGFDIRYVQLIKELASIQDEVPQRS